jgi:YgiT-type zinc finger domain-containing protein
MKCVICKRGETSQGSTTVSVTRGECTVVVKGVPAQICENCGEYYLAEDVAARVFEMADTAVKSGAEIEVRRYAA